MNDWTPDKILHKMKSPLTSLLGYAEMVKIKVKKDPKDPKIEQWLDKIRQDALVIKEMILKLEEHHESKR
jgi:hypothetical protein